MRLNALALLAVSLLLLGCLGFAEKDIAGNCIGSCPPGTHLPASGECACVSDDWASSWEIISMMSVFTVIFLISILYMFASAMDMERVKFALKDEYFQAIASGVFVLALGAFLWSANNFFLPGLASTFDLTTADVPPSFAPAFSPSGTIDSFAFAESYTKEISGRLADYTARMEVTVDKVGSTSTLTTFCQILGSSLGFSVSQCRYLASTQGTLSLAITALFSASMALWMQSMLLQTANQFAIFLLPLGILLRTVRFTRAAGGAMIAIAVGFFIFYPFTIIADYALIKDEVFMGPAPYKTIAIPTGPHNDLGACIGDTHYVSMLMDKSNFIEPMAYWVIIVSILLPAINILITLTFIGWLSSFLGSEIMISQLARTM